MSRLLDYFLNKWPYTDFHELNADWLINAYKVLINEVDKLDEWKATHEVEYQELKKLYDDMLSGNYPDTFVDALTNWINTNAMDLIGELVKMVFFGLTNDGYFVAYIPDSWDDITFGTSGLDDFPIGVDFGHLTLTY